MHTVLLVPTVHNHLVEVLFSTLLDPDRPTWTHEVYQYIYFKQQTDKFNVELLHYNIEIFLPIMCALGINGEWHME